MFFGCCGCQGGSSYWLRKYTNTPGVNVIAEASHPIEEFFIYYGIDPGAPPDWIGASGSDVALLINGLGACIKFVYNQDLDLINTLYINGGAQSFGAVTNGSWIAMRVSSGSTYDSSITVKVYNDSGNLIYSKLFSQWVFDPFGGTGWFKLCGILLDSSNNLYVTAFSGANFVGSFVRTWKYNSAGTQQWVQTQSAPVEMNAFTSIGTQTYLAMASDGRLWIARPGRIERWNASTGTSISLGYSDLAPFGDTNRHMQSDGSAGMWVLHRNTNGSVTVRRFTSSLVDAFTPFIIQSSSLRPFFAEGTDFVCGTGPYTSYDGYKVSAPLVRWATDGSVNRRWESSPAAQRPLFWHNGQVSGLLHTEGMVFDQHVYVAGARTQSYP